MSDDILLYNTSASALDSYVYTYDQGNERTQVVRTGENYANYGYDSIGELTSDVAYESATHVPRANENLVYGFDVAGNLANRTNNILSGGSIVQSFRVNSLNELTTNTNSNNILVLGNTSSSASTVTVNGVGPITPYGDGTFVSGGQLPTTNYTAIAHDSYGRWSTNTVNVNLATNVIFQYDANGNLTNDGMRSFVYDDENELIQVSVSSQWLSQYQYDGKMRRRIRQDYAWTGSTWTETNEVHYVYDGNLVIQERDQYNLPRVTYTRGKDLSGSLEGAGGIGGLLGRTAQSYSDASLGGQSFYHSDANGNVTMLTDSRQGVVAKYLYDAFGDELSKSGMQADANVYHFSSKEREVNSGLVYYLYRFYDPNLQRWPNGDPNRELGFNSVIKHTTTNRDANLYRFCDSDPIDRTDAYGLDVDSTTQTMLQCAKLPRKDMAFCVCTLLTADNKEESDCEKKLGSCIDALAAPSKKAACKCACESAFPDDSAKQSNCKKTCDCLK